MHRVVEEVSHLWNRQRILPDLPLLELPTLRPNDDSWPACSVVDSISPVGFHARAFRREEVTLHTVVGGTAGCGAFAQEHGFAKHTTDLAAALAWPEFELAVIASPTYLHSGQFDLALRARKHVLVEIPLATSLAEADRLIGLAAQLDRRLNAPRYRPRFVALPNAASTKTHSCEQVGQMATG